MSMDKCKVCDTPLSLVDSFCPKCGFERHVLPKSVSKDVEDYEKERIRNYKEKLELQKQSIEETGKQVALISEKNKKLEEQQNVLEQLLEVEKENVKDLTKALEDANKYKNELFDSIQKNDKLKKQNSMLESAVKVLQVQHKDLIEKLKNANDNLAKEKNEHKETKIKLEQFEADNLTYVKPEQPKAHPQPCPGVTQQQDRPVAKIIFSCGTQTIQKDVFDGNNKYKIPVSMNSSVSGDAFRIESLNGEVFRLYDLCGLTCKVNGDKILTAGMQLYDKDYFTVGHITIQIKLPKMNLRDLLK